MPGRLPPPHPRDWAPHPRDWALHPRDWTLRARLIASFLGLLLVVCVGIGVLADLAVKNSLTSALDRQLTSAGGNFHGGGRGAPDGDGPRLALPPGSPIGAVGVYLGGGTVLNSQLEDAANTHPPLASDVTGALAAVPADGHPHGISLPGLGDYRATSVTTDGGLVRVLAFPLKDVHDTLNRVTLAIVGLTLLALVVAGLVGASIVRLALRPLRRVTATASRVAEMNLEEGEVAVHERVPDANPRTEVGQVGVALNRMLANVTDALNARHRSETRVRQFVADASHELRTPLAAIRGYAELTRRSREIAPPDIAHAMSRVESEAGRMTTLVEDLLLLARLDAGRPLDRAEVDLTRMAVDALSDAHAAGPDHSWRLELPDDPVLVQGDGPRLHQVVANLLANARTHTPPGTTVTLSLATAADQVLLSVADDGPGIPAALMPEIFQRFSRGEESRSRKAGSTGLGLAIVAAVVAAHGGRIEVRSLPGDTRFTVTLPVHGIPSDSAQTAASKAYQAV
ncbi:MAG TPA: HAMP domain-containing sensor histidine kinase [Jatrophihabitans sp.]|nr:HAMP domain-containing sensor histidine kinase [Jatrophihabitans sp.]